MRIVLAILVGLVAAGAAGAGCQMVKVSEIKILADGNRFYVPGGVNAKPVLFLVDTGSEYSMLTEDGANALGLGAALTRGSMYGATGSAMNVGSVRVDDLTLGQWAGHNLHLLVAGHGLNTRNGTVVAILGEDFLRNFDVEFDVKDGLITLFQPKGCDDANLAYWSDSYNVVDMLGHENGSHHIIVDAKVNDYQVRTLLDSGAPFSSLTETTALAIGVGPGSPGVVPVGEVHGASGVPVEAWLATFGSFTLDQETIKPAKLRFHRLAKVEAPIGSLLGHTILNIQMILGADFIRAHRLLIANSQHKVYFTYAGGAAFQSVGPRLSAEAGRP